MGYEGDVAYEIWRMGGNPDSVHPDRIADYKYEGYSADEAASRILRRDRERREIQRQEQAQQEQWERDQQQADFDREQYERAEQEEQEGSATG